MSEEAQNSVPRATIFRPGPHRGDQKETKYLEKCMKLVSVLVVWILLIGSICSSQISIFHLSMKLGVLSNFSDTNELYFNPVNVTISEFKTDFTSVDRIEATKMYTIVVLAAVTPYLMNAARAIQITWGTNMIMPDRKMIFWGLLSALLESVGVSLLIFRVFPIYNGVVCSLLVCCISLVPLISIFFTGIRRDWRCRLAILAVVLQVIGTLFMVIWMAMVSDLQHKLRFVVPSIAILCLSLAWLPPVQKHSVQTESEMARLRNRRRSDEDDYFRHALGGSASESESELTPSQDVEEVARKAEAAWKMALISNIAKTAFVIVIAAIMFLKDRRINPDGTSWNMIWEEFKLAWNSWTFNYDVAIYISLTVTCAVAHGVGLLLCQISKSMVLLLFPGYVSNVIILFALWNPDICNRVLPETPDVCNLTMYPQWAVVISTLMIALAAIMSLLVFGIKREHILLRRESQIVWLPTFSSVAPGMWMVLNKRMWPWDREQGVVVQQYKKAHIFICTTMYRETKEEMKELLKSYKNINAMCKSDSADRTRYEFHIVMDDGARDTELNKFALKLLALIRSVLRIPCGDLTKVYQPYGQKLTWSPKTGSFFRLPLTIHIKDSSKVKQKKRWSQIMYMEYILNHIGARTDADTYILATDADVKFNRTAVEALVDLMTRDRTVGAVTGDTRPLNIGSGPCVWYQVFEYAAGHWFLKAAEHILGSVLCASGCFSLFRCSALKDVLSEYSSDVNCGLESLTKDKGEDRWLSTLLLMRGWNIEYCATSSNKTNCPDTFRELYQQRSRWILSAIANTCILMKDYMKMRSSRIKGMMIGNIFMIYQGIMLWATIIAPSTVILVVSGGIELAFGFASFISIIIQVLIVVVYAVLCYCQNLSTRHLLSIAQGITFFYCFVMVAVAYGGIQIVVNEFDNIIKGDNRISAVTGFIVTLVGIYLVASLLHWELTSFFCGIFFFLFIPSGYLLLPIFSLCNMPDISWGTREEEKSVMGEKSLMQLMSKDLKKIGPWLLKLLRKCRCRCKGVDLVMDDENLLMLEVIATTKHVGNTRNLPGCGLDVEEWMSLEFQEELPSKYCNSLRFHGYGNTVFLSQLEIEDLEKIGILNLGHRKMLMAGIERLPVTKVPVTKPTDVGQWLNSVGLGMYKCGDNIKPTDIYELEKPLEEIAELLKIQKQGHIDRLDYALRCVRFPNRDEVAAEKAKEELEKCILIDVTNIEAMGGRAENDSAGEDEEDGEGGDAVQRGEVHSTETGDEQTTHPDTEYAEIRERHVTAVKESMFWKELIDRCLDPRIEANCDKKQVKADLVKQKKSWMIVMTLTNVIWLVLIYFLAANADLTTLGVTVLGGIVLGIFLFLIAIQFVTMLFHRGNTLIHILARMSSFSPSSQCCNVVPFYRSFREWCNQNDPVDEDAEVQSICCPCLPCCNPRIEGHTVTERAPLIQSTEEEQH